MTVSLKHIFQSAKTDSADVTIVQPSNWNEEHQLTLATNKVLGRATAGTGAAEELSIGTALSISGGTLAVTTVPAANGGTGLTSPGTSGNVLVSNGTGWTSGIAPSVVSYAQNIQSANYTLVLGDAGKQIFHPASDTATRTYTIPSNASVAFPIGTVVLFTVENAAFPVSVAISSDTLILGSGTTGTATVSPNNTLMAIKVTATKWMANYLFDEEIAPYSIAVTHNALPMMTVYPWRRSGFGTPFLNPYTLPVGASQGFGVAFSPAGNALAYGYDTVTPNIDVYRWTTSGFGVPYSAPATVPSGQVQGIAFSPSANAIAVSSTGSPYIQAYPWNATTGFGTKYANPATLPTGLGGGVAFSPAGTSVAIAHATTPFVSAYPWTVGSGFGTKYANPGTLPTNQGLSVAFSPASDAIIVSSFNTPFVLAYPWNSATGFGTKYADPATLPSSAAYGVAFNPDGTSVAVASNGSPYLQAYPWNSATGFGTKYTDPAANAINSSGRGVAFSPAGDAVAVTSTTTPYIVAFRWSKNGFGSKYDSPTTLPTGNANSVAFNVNP